ncbi:MAG: geranylgeranylglyceryl/heptaprenylglyceryl phosphate synthase [Candidatus Diapherotrites archaeon]|nr:geranylgeranylglyceryl/heptaprenylglyceryl phosphate synthase [Candidatus Diapherotrites archaeon]
MSGNVYEQAVLSCVKEGGGVFLVIDPPNQPPSVAGEMAKAAKEAGVKAIAVGGSVGAQGELLDQTILAIKKNASLPVILFPGNVASLSKHADAIYFMSLLNSNDPYYISGAQIASAMPVKKMGLEVIPTSYVLVEPGRAVGWVGRAQLIPRNLAYLAAATVLAGEFMGSKLAILESGGGAPEPVPAEMIAYTKKISSLPLVVAGGVRTPQGAFNCIAAGADIVHVGTAVEESHGNVQKALKSLKELVAAVRKAAMAKRKN